CRHELASPGAGSQAYARSHIPGAQFMHVDHDLSARPDGHNGRHPLPDAEQFAARLSAAGVDASSQVVAYDAAGGMFAARLWWMLRWLGHDRVAVLDGGWGQWQSEQRPTSTAQPVPQPARFVARPRALAVDTPAVLANLRRRERLVLDARSADRFRGENETLDPLGGHIPGAANRPFRDNLDAAGRFKPAAQLRTEFAAALGAHAPDKVIHQCGSGVSACHNLLAMEIAGLQGSLLYPGSWSEWCADPSRPIAK
ncbi:MAG: sulfurtransferase, partial [Betaproteobacteria bacterium]|nr:sulfurtransferase [Betaproteobacteria bacterium]